MEWKHGIAAACFVGMIAAQAGLAQTDVEGSKDHPLVSRYPGSVIDQYSSTEFDEFTLPLGKLKDGVPEKSQHLEGKITRISYAAPAGRSILEVYRNYESALRKAGFAILYECVNNEGCWSGSPTFHAASGNEDWGWSAGQRYLSAKQSRAEGDVYVSLHIGQWSDLSRGSSVVLFVVEVKPMEGGLITADAAALASDITQTGHSAVYGIHFDTGRADVKPESEAALTEIAKLLQQDSGLKLLVVGHTDNVGTLASNMDLSKRRADAVVRVLTTRNGIAASRLIAQGAGPLAPVASNKAEEGRAKNRRVELVEQ
ncbi:MAG: OmpA family protein [Bryobacteraceae bacterium]|jgi:outer membrane protein OmpA-like peptidoglycan-associated protein